MGIPCGEPPWRQSGLLLERQPLQEELFEEDRFTTYRVLCTNLKVKLPKIISQYDKRADAENLIREAKREGLDAIASAKFKNNYADFQIVMLRYQGKIRP